MARARTSAVIIVASMAACFAPRAVGFALLARQRSRTTTLRASADEVGVSRRHSLRSFLMVGGSCSVFASEAWADALGSDQFKSGIRGADPNGDGKYGNF